nr:hypothetical protein [Gordonia araii]
MAAGAGSATAGPAAASTCESVRLIATSTPRTPGIDWAENIGYDPDGRLWVTRTAGSAVQRLDRAGRVVGSVSVPFPGAVRSGPGGQMYVTSFTSSLPGLTTSGVIYRFDPKSPKPVARVFARGLGLPNGLAFDDDGFGYVGDTWRGVVRLRRNGTIDHAWSARAPQNLRPTATVNGTSINGVAVIGDNLYVTMTTSLTGRVLRVPVSEPARTTVAADLTAPLPGFLDDLARVGRNRLAVASSTGQLYIVDAGSGRFCGVQVGQPVTSVAAHPHDPKRFAVGTDLGNVLQFQR